MSADEVAERLRAAGCVYAEEEAAVLLDEAETRADPDGELESMLTRRESGLPLEQIVGWADFAGIRVVLEPGVFVPRARSELLVRLAVERLAGRTSGSSPVLVDLCCGSGALAAAVVARVPHLTPYAADLDPAAVTCARRNLPAHRVFEGDLYGALPAELHGRVDVLVVNAPYVPTDALATMPAEAREHEHRLALDGGADGLDVQRRVIATAADWLAPDGRLLVETGLEQVPTTSRMMAEAGLDAEPVSDPEIGGSAVCGRRPQSRSGLFPAGPQ